MTTDEIPNPQDFFLRTPLYEAIQYEGEQVFKVAKLLHFEGHYDSYCLGCGKESTFHVEPGTVLPTELGSSAAAKWRQFIKDPDLVPQINTGIYKLTGVCTRSKYHKHVFFIMLRSVMREGRGEFGKFDYSFLKVGQHPSVADLAYPEIKRRYANVLEKGLMADLSRGLDLGAHGIGIGAYVYLRRVFEALVEEAHVVAMTREGWDEKAYRDVRMAGKVKLLTDLLPSFLAERPKLYNVLSKGVHELSEDECMEHFDTIRGSIELILDQKVAEKERIEKERALSAAFDKTVNATMLKVVPKPEKKPDGP